MRVTQGMMYNDMQYNMNRVLSDYMESNYQGATQKRINRPSDDPTGSVRVLSYRASLESTTQYIDNSKNAASWLSSTDAALMQAQVILQKITGLAEQAATETLEGKDRLNISFELKELFGQLMNIANTEFAGDHLFAGHQTGDHAYEEGLGVMSESAEVGGVTFDVDGALDKTAMIRFPDGGVVDDPLPADLKYEYSKDGGATWETKVLPAGTTPPTLDIDGAQVTFGDNNPDDATAALPVTLTAFDAGAEISPSNGTMLYVRKSAEYVGDDNDAPPEVDIFGNADLPGGGGKKISAEADGKFTSNVQVRIDDDAQVNADGTVNYSYSKDNGLTWESATATTRAGDTSVRLNIPGGYVDLAVGGDGKLPAGQQLVVRPNRASDIGHEISKDEYLDVTNSGKDIFGGTYKTKGDELATVVGGPNIFESVADLIAWTETNNSDGCAEALETLKTSSEHLLTQLAKVGGKENRVSLNVSILESHTDDQKSRMSSIEDIDIGELSIKLKKEQMAYQTVLQSSSMVMNLSLLNYM